MQPAPLSAVADARAPRARLPLPVLVWLALYTALAVAAALLLERAAAMDAAFHWRSLAAMLGGAALFAWLAAVHWRAPRFGAANLVTLGRAALTMLLIALLGAAPSSRVAWVGVGLATLAAVLDGVDGRIARLRNEATPFGARFDMETDALLMLVLAVLVWRIGHAGPWVLAAGLLRYGFVLAGRAWPALARPLPPSERRRRICGVAIALLSIAAAPLPPEAVSALCAIAVGSLIYSFAVDGVWLVRYAPGLPAGACRS